VELMELSSLFQRYVSGVSDPHAIVPENAGGKQRESLSIRHVSPDRLCRCAQGSREAFDSTP